MNLILNNIYIYIYSLLEWNKRNNKVRKYIKIILISINIIIINWRVAFPQVAFSQVGYY